MGSIAQSAEARALQGTDGARQPFWSDDSRSIGFFTSTQLKTVSLETKSIAVLASVVSAAGRAWHGETIVHPEFYNWPALQGHDIRQLTSGRDHARSLGWPGRRSPPGVSPRWPARAVLRYRKQTDLHERSSGRDANAPDIRRFWAVFAPPGHLLFLRQGTLLVQSFDPERRTLTGTAQALVEDISTSTSGRPAVSVSHAGLLAYRTGRNLIRGQYVWFDRAGAEIARVGAPERDRQSNPNLSPDGSRVALQRSVAGNLADLWLLELNPGTFTPIVRSDDRGFPGVVT